jgi:hypothetical protein
MVDMVVHRHKLRSTISRICRLLGAEAEAGGTLPAPVGDAPAAEPVPATA